MPFCSKCGAQIPEQSAFCPQCGQTQAGAPPAVSGATPVAGAGTQSGLSENAAGAICYVVGWLTGIIFFLVDKRPLVRFHAAQSIVAFGALHILHLFLGRIFVVGLFFGGLHGLSMGWLLLSLVNLATFVLWILLMVKAGQGERFKLPTAGDLAEQFAGKQ